MFSFTKRSNLMAEAIIKSVKEYPEKWREDSENEFYIGDLSSRFDLSKARQLILIWGFRGQLRVKFPTERTFPHYWNQKLIKVFNEWRELPAGMKRFLDILTAAELWEEGK